MQCKFPYNENFVVFAKRMHADGNGNLIINFAWPNTFKHILAAPHASIPLQVRRFIV